MNDSLNAKNWDVPSYDILGKYIKHAPFKRLNKKEKRKPIDHTRDTIKKQRKHNLSTKQNTQVHHLQAKKISKNILQQKQEKQNTI